MESLMYLKIDAFRQNTKKEKKRKEKNEKSSRTILAPKCNELYGRISNRTISVLCNG